MKLSIVIPCYNEEENMGRLANALKRYEKYEEIEFILVDNGSTDHTGIILKKIAAKSSNIILAKVEENQGYGYGIKQGIAKASGIYVGWLHADMQISPYEIVRIYHFLEKNHWEEHYFIKGIRSSKNRSMSERLFTSVMGLIATAALGRRKLDTNGIPVVIPRCFYNQLKHIPNDVLIELFLYDAAQRKGLTEKRMKVNYRNREFGKTKLLPDSRSKVNAIRKTVHYLFVMRRENACYQHIREME